ncbi:Nre family DNA repair protein [Sulfolobus tengchongensis]|uniref:DNA repair protein n=1 Tax=Sulfolobus tengchongensis TaxID=207809 RepID=A0AAX4KWR9_9CREN
MIRPELCIRCRGAKYLCGLSYCPIIVTTRIRKINTTEVLGSSPPTVFVGRYNYPKITIYPSSPPVIGDTSKFEDPKYWLTSDLNEFLSMRLSLVRGGIRYHRDAAKQPDRLLIDIQSITIASRPVDLDLVLKKPPSGGILDDSLPPLGPSAPLEKLEINTLPPPLKVTEKVYGDSDMKAKDGIMMLYKSGLDVEKIAKILSVGGLGIDRKLVPTRWSITAIDKIVSDSLIEKIKNYETIDKIEVYYRQFNKNLFVAFLLPKKWSFEWGEAWFPGSTWNKWGNYVNVEIDNEGYEGRTEYPEIGGCYYASRLGTAEFLEKRKRQATAILWREIYSGFNLPVGVWFVRENVREMFKQKPFLFDDITSALAFAESLLKVDIKKWLRHSMLSYNTIDKWLK